MADVPAYLDAILTDRYRVERELGSGGMATVYLAKDLKLDRDVALKVLSPELGAVLGAERFLAEIKITARLDHPHILTLIDSGSAGGHLYYVLPYVRGESLRDHMRRETQLGIEQAIAITKQVASALDYAHKNGVVHRDIKPENILLQEGEAMLADFGIALAVKEAGGDRLTQTGLSLGTPQYMSPEQATGDRRLDARSDVYSLAAVLYEMLVGDPPMSGATVQAVIAKLLTEAPTRVRVVRPSVPQGVDDAIAKALSKVPSDRFATAGDFVRALEAGVGAVSPSVATAAATPSPKGRGALWVAGLAVIALSGFGWAYATGRIGSKDTSAALRERRQLTFSGNISTPAISPDGKQIAYFVKECTGANCSYALVEQDVGNTTTRHIVDGLAAGYGVEWSADRRNLLIAALLNGKGGTYLVSALGGPPKFLTSGAATFYSGGDSLLVAASASDTTFTVRIAGLDGTVRDSLRIPGHGEYLAALSSIPGTTRFAAMIIQPPHGLWQIVDRMSKQVTDKLVNSCTCGGTASRDAIWMTRAGPTLAEAVVRVAVDKNGKFAQHQDTIYSGRFSGVSVTEDGTQMAVDDGSLTFINAAVSMKDLMTGSIPPSAAQLQSTTRSAALVSPDGARVLRLRSVPAADGGDELRLSVLPFEGGTETALATTGRVIFTRWTDPSHVLVTSTLSGHVHLSLLDITSGATVRSFDAPDSTTRAAVALPNGWAWIDAKAEAINIAEDNGARRKIPRPKGVATFNDFVVSRDGTRFLTNAWVNSDSLAFDVIPVAGGTPERWATVFADHASMRFAADSTVLLTVWTGPETASLFKLTGPGSRTLVGAIPHIAAGIGYSDDLQRAAIGWRQSSGDAWLYRVVKPQQ